MSAEDCDICGKASYGENPHVIYKNDKYYVCYRCWSRRDWNKEIRRVGGFFLKDLVILYASNFTNIKLLATVLMDQEYLSSLNDYMMGQLKSLLEYLSEKHPDVMVLLDKKMEQL